MVNDYPHNRGRYFIAVCGYLLNRKLGTFEYTTFMLQVLRMSTRWGSSTAFRNNLSTLRELLSQLETVWRAWPSFSGIVLNGFDIP